MLPLNAVIFVLILHVCSLLDTATATDTKFDFLIFTQHWPITVCMEWEENRPTNNCTLPPKENLWTIHGIWPTKKGTEGPNYCNKTAKFIPNALEPILPDLELYWMNIEANTPLYSLWKHEWVKHGTCAAQLPVFNSEVKYFRKGLEWIQEYGMNIILSKSGIEPRQEGYFVTDLYNSIKKILKKAAYIVCVVDKKTKISLISEIRLCFDKNLTLVDCEMVMNDGFYSDVGEKILTNCDSNKMVMYYDEVPAFTTESRKRTNYLDKLYNTYQLIQQLIWATI
ncbi:ribonuclease T2 [Atheta coriaria]|uniref:ribonuclease T2 n=1 Tax=Dalotia coriaria TaxID=877792 RepID=UPI0031F3891D